MVAKKAAKAKKKKGANSNAYGTPNFPYAYTPAALGRFLGLIPKKPKPDKVNAELLKAWGFLNSNDRKIVGVLKEIEFLDAGGQPTSSYIEFMTPGKGAEALGRQIKKVYDSLFKTVSNHNDNSELQSFFNTYGGGGEKVIQLQTQTFKALAQHATFGKEDPLSQDNEQQEGVNGDAGSRVGGGPGQGAIHIDLHIHLPEEKTKADYDSILESVGKHIYGRNP